jgi:hypothetical protein
MRKPKAHSGRCLCGSVRYTVALKWFQSSKHTRRGFCGKCGSSLFGTSPQWPFISISAASLNEPTGLKLAVHSWTKESADYWSFDPKVGRKRGPSGLGGPPARARAS